MYGGTTAVIHIYIWVFSRPLHMHVWAEMGRYLVGHKKGSGRGDGALAAGLFGVRCQHGLLGEG